METIFGLEVVVDDDLHDRAVAGELYCWLAEQARDSGCWPRCGCERRGTCCLDDRVVKSSTGGLALQEIDRRTGLPRAPEQRRLDMEAKIRGRRHTMAQAWS